MDLSPPDRTLVERVYRRAALGTVVRGVLSAEDCEGVISRAQDLPRHLLHGRADGPYSLGLMLAPTYDHPTGPDLDTYFAAAEEVNPVLEPIRARLEGAFAQCTSVPVQRLDAPRPHGTGSLRHFHHDESVPWHMDTYRPSPSFAHLAELTDRRVQLSWYIPVSAPEAGGLLQVRAGHRATDASGASEALLDIPLGRGDLVLFDGANFDHQITTIQGSIPRITLGGFSGLRRDHGAFLYWG